MNLIEKIIERAKSNKQRIVLPEALEERTITAADKALADGLAELILLGNIDQIHALAQKLGLKNIDKATLIDPATSDKREEYAQLLFELRKKKGMTIEQAREKVLDPLYFGCLIIKSGDADGQISGALSTTGDTLRPALQIIKCSPGITCVSGAMLMITQTPQYGEDGVLVIGDVAVTPMPDANQLAQIAVCTAQTARSVAGFDDPRVAMLSFSTKGSAKHEVCDKVIEATALAKQLDVSVQTIRLDRLELGIPELRGRIRKMAENAQNKVKAIQSNEVVGELIDLELGHSGISLLKITEDMVFGKTQIAKGHFMFSQADSLAMAIVDAPMAVTGVANVKYKVPVHVGEKLIAKAEIVKVRGNKYFIWVKTHNETQEVFRAKFIVVSWGEK